ncbi:MAG: hypothetical protein AB1394_15655, partial [Bacteroidota bacterium]
MQPVAYGYDMQRGWLASIADAGGIFTKNLTYLTNGIRHGGIHNYGDGSWGNYTYSFIYDNMNRLTVASSTIPDNSESYTYNGDGRILTKNRTNNVLSMTAVNGTNRINSVGLNGSNYSFAYDTKGNVTNDGLNNALLGNYSFRNLPLVVSPSNHNFNYAYNDNGERIKKTEVDSARTDYYLRDYFGRELVIYNYETNDPKQVNIYGNGLIGKIEIDTTETRSYYLKDHLGNIRCVVNNDGTLLNAQD